MDAADQFDHAREVFASDRPAVGVFDAVEQTGRSWRQLPGGRIDQGEFPLHPDRSGVGGCEREFHVPRVRLATGVQKCRRATNSRRRRRVR